MVHNRIKKKTLPFKLVSALMIASLSATLAPANLSFMDEAGISRVEAAETGINGHSYVTENSSYRLYMNEEDLSVVIEDKQTGSYLESSISYDDGKNNDTWLAAMRSAVVVTMINGNDDTKQADLINDNVKKTITYTDNGFSAELYWMTYKFGFTLDVCLDDNGFVAGIKEASIKEDSDKYFIGTISMYPYLGNSYLDDKEGYLFVPDGNGALIYLDNKEGRFKSGFSAMIYGNDIGFDESSSEVLLWDRYNTVTEPEQIIAPVFGIAHTDDEIGYLAIVEDGKERASIEAAPNGVSVDYNRAYAKFILRKLYTQPTSNNSTAGSLHTYESDRSHSDLQVRYLFLSGDKANYTGMATAYREYLLKNGLLTNQDCSYNTRIDFLGTERENWLLGTSAVVMTTVEDIREIYRDLDASGVTELLSVYKGWQKGGLYDIPISKYSADSKIGGTNDLTKLIKDAAAEGKKIYLYDNALMINPDEQNATFHVVKKINKRRYEETTYKEVYEKMLYLIPDRTSAVISSLVKSYTKKGVNNLCVAGISNTLFTYTYSGNKYTRFDTAASYANTAGTIDASVNLVLEQPFEYLWANTEAFLDMPLYTSSYILEDESIPFLSIVLKGTMPVYSEYVNFEANKQEFFLKMVETGTYPSFYITKESSSELIYTNSSDVYSSEYSTYKDTIVEYTKKLSELNEKLCDAVIVSHEITGTGVTKVTYSNGVKVYVNYGSEAVTVDGITIGTMSYEVTE